MTNLAVAIVAGLLFGGGIVAAIAGLTPTEPKPSRLRAIDWERMVRPASLAVGVTAAAVVAWWVTGWPVAALAVVATLWLAPRMVATSRAQRRDRQMLEATRQWIQQLDTQIGAGVGLEKALRESARQVRHDSPLAGPLTRTVERLDWMGTGPALKALSTELDNHVGDAATVVLASAMTHSSRGLRPALRALGDWADDQIDHLRQVEVETQSLRKERRYVLALAGSLIAYLAATSPELMGAYATATGQIVLLVLSAMTGGVLWLSARLSQIAGAERFFHQDDTTRGAGR